MADTGFAFRGTCYQLEQGAREEHCRSEYPQSFSDASGSYVVSCTGVQENGLALSRTTGSGSASSVVVQTTYPTCTPGVIGASPFDGAQATQAFGFGFTLVMLVYLVAWGCGRILAFIGAN